MAHNNSTGYRNSIKKPKEKLQTSESRLFLLQLRHKKLVSPTSSDNDSVSNPKVVATETPHNTFFRYLFDMCNCKKVESTTAVPQDGDGWHSNPSWFNIASNIGVCQQEGYNFPKALFPLGNNGTTLYAIALDRQSSTLVKFYSSLVTQR